MAQPEVKPGCVLRRSNIGVLENKKLISGNDVSTCLLDVPMQSSVVCCLPCMLTLRLVSSDVPKGFGALQQPSASALLTMLHAQVNQCVRNANTFAFVGDLDKSPEVSCVYHSEEAENQFVRVFCCSLQPSLISGCCRNLDEGA